MKDLKHNIGLVSVSFRKNEPREILEAMRNAGLSHIEWGSDIHAPYNDRQRLEELVRLQNEDGINCSSYGTYFKLGITPLDELKGYIDAAKLLGTNILRLWCGNRSGAVMTDDEKNALTEICRSAAAIAEENGVILCMECHRNTLTEQLNDALALMREVNSPSFRMYWQPFQWLEPEQSCEIAKALSPYVEHIHVFNWKGTERFPLSLAVDTWREYLKNFDGKHTLLLEFMPDDLITTLPQEAQALKLIAE